MRINNATPNPHARLNIAKYTAEDPFASLPDEQDVADTWTDLDLFHPWAITSEDA